jgi:hypothetical protein
MMLAKDNPFLIHHHNAKSPSLTPIRFGPNKVNVDIRALRHFIEIVRAKLLPSTKH